ncbi:MAG: hemerythrin domain-containing protein [Deltaproteobacteria bacterium]|nr:hemerythrin domain-containing protein [Deltaproteobacteria bacterium]
MKLAIPGSVKAEHDDLHHELRLATEVEGPIGEAARRLAGLMHPHFAREEDYALPPLAALLPIAQDMQPPEPEKVIAMTAKLKATLSVMFAEHRVIADAARALADAAKEAGRPEYVDFAQRILLHARMEEEILYPAAIIAGEILRRK